MRKNIAVGVIAIMAVLALNCKKAAPSGVTAAIASIHKAMADATGPLEKANDGGEAAKLIEGVSAVMEGAMAKYPELKAEGAKSPEIKAAWEKGKDISDKFGAAVMSAVDNFKGTVEVQNAAAKLPNISMQ